MELLSYLKNSEIFYYVKTDIEGRINFVNNYFLKVYGYSSEKLIGQLLTSIIHPSDKSNYQITIEKILLSPGDHPHKIILQIFNNTKVDGIRLVEWETFINSGSNGIKEIIFIGTQLANEQESGERKYRSLFEQASDAIMITDFDGNFIDVNTSLCNLFGYSHEELLRMNISSLIDANELIERPIVFNRLAQGQHIINDRKMLHRNGKIIEVEANVKKFGNNLVLAIARDVTELRNTQRLIQISESKFRSAFENSAIGMVLVSIDGKFLKVNSEFCKMMGYEEKELLHLHFQDITLSEDLKIDLLNIENTLKGKYETFKVEKRYIHKNGSIIWGNLNVSLIKDDKAQPIYFVGQVEDISNRKKQQDAIKESEERYKALVENAPEALVVLDVEQRKFVSVSESASSLFKLPKEELLKIGPVELSPEYQPNGRLSSELATEKIKEAIRGNKPSFEWIHFDAKGNSIPCEISLVRLPSDKRILVRGSIVDITERKKLEARMLEYVKLLEELSFVTSHELRHEYSKAQSAITFLDKVESKPEEQKMLIKEISKSFNNINSLIYKLNDKISFNQREEIVHPQEKVIHVENILLVDDDELTNFIHKRVLESTLKNKIPIEVVSGVDPAIKYLSEKDKTGNHLIFLDLNMPRKSGWDFLEEYNNFKIKSPVIILSSSIDPADREKAGKYEIVRNFISKPLSAEFAIKISDGEIFK